MTLLETKRLIVKPSNLDNIENVYALFSDPEVMKYVGQGVKSLDETREALQKMINHYEKHQFGFGDVYEKETGHYVGRAGLIYLEMKDDQPEIEVGYLLHKKYWKKGYATELAKGFIDWGFKHLPVEKLVAVICPENEASRHVLEKSKFCYIGREHCYDNEVAIYEILKNQIDYSKLALIPATLNDLPIMQNMARFYAYDISEHYGHVIGWEMEDDGLYEVGIDFKKYWESKDTFPFLIRYKDELAGFAIVDKKGSDDTVDFNMAQFFILRTLKCKGIGQYIANLCFNQFQGEWEIMVMPGNESAYRFWRRTVKKYSNNNYVEYTRKVAHFNSEKRNFFRFNSEFAVLSS